MMRRVRAAGVGAAALALLAGREAGACVVPGGLETLAQVNLSLGLLAAPFAALTPSGPAAEALGLVPLLVLVVPIVNSHETPLQFLFTQVADVATYGALASYEPNALDWFGDEVPKICMDATNDWSEEMITVHQKLSGFMALGYGATLGFTDATKETFDAIMEGYNLADEWDLMFDDTFDACAETAPTPWGLGKCSADRAAAKFLEEASGWNVDGKTSCDYNCRTYSDFSYTDAFGEVYSGYQTSNPYQASTPDNQWQPLAEANGKGFFFHQDHVVPHIGITARMYGMGDREEQCAFMNGKALDPPNYDYAAEAQFAFEETKVTAEDDTGLRQALVETFDAKLNSLIIPQFGWAAANGLSDYDIWRLNAGFNTAALNSVILSWREKVRHNLVRPTTVAHAMGDERVETYAGPYQGVQSIKAGEWEPFIRTMPHAEYPSGSSCVCTVWAEWAELISGRPDIFPPGSMDTPKPAGSSFMEPGARPPSDITLSFESWADVADMCGVSRTYGGMHYSKSVEAGNDLCTGLAAAIFTKMELLNQGDPAGKMTDASDGSDEAITLCPFDESGDTPPREPETPEEGETPDQAGDCADVEGCGSSKPCVRDEACPARVGCIQRPEDDSSTGCRYCGFSIFDEC